MSDLFTGGGLETRILEQVRAYREHGVGCYLVTDQYNTELVKEFKGVLRLPLLSQDRKAIMENVDAVIGFCRENAIEMIDVQPLHSLIIAGFASAVLQLPMSYTLHGIYSIPPADDSLISWFHIVLELRCPQIVLVAEYLQDTYSKLLNGKDAKVVQNGVLLPKRSVQGVSSGRWIFASRLSKEKYELLLEAAPLLEEAGVRQLDIFGGGEKEKQVLDFLDTFNTDAMHKMKINFCGWCKSLVDEVLNGGYEGGIGMDRVAVEMMATGLPTMILGYGGLTDGVSAKNFDELMHDNFTSWEKVSENNIIRNLEAMRKRPEGYNMRKLVQEKMNSAKIWTSRLKGVEELKTDLGRDAMLMAVWQDFYENEKKTQVIKQLQKRFYNTLEGKIYQQLKKILPRGYN